MEFITFGCKVNQYETQLLKENKHLLGTNNNLCIINTCCVTGKVEKEIRRVIRKKLREGKQVWVTGCLVNKEKGKLLSDFPNIKIFDKFDFFEKKTISSFNSHTRAFVKIEDGCENKCSYCIVPLVRGRVRSRREEEIIQEVKNLVENGYKEVVLTGIDLGAYGKDTGEKLTDLIEKISKIKGLRRLRLSSIEVFYIDENLIDFLSDIDIFCPHFHIPLQSGSDRVLKLMRRKYNFSTYVNVIEMIRKKIKNVTITTDLIVGFPGESESDFIESCKAVEKIKFLKVHIFPFSPRENTEAFLMKEKISNREKKEREKILFSICEKVRRKVMKEFFGVFLSVLVEKKEGNFWTGYSENYIPFIFSCPDNIKNEIVRVKGIELKKDRIYGIIEKEKIKWKTLIYGI